MRPRTLYLVAAVLSLFVAFAGCNSGDVGVGNGTGTGTGTGDGGPGGPDLPPPKACPTPCTAPQICSAAGVCIDVGTCADSRDCSEGRVCDVAAKACVPADNCGAEQVSFDAVAPDLLIMLDRSCSMTPKVNGVSKWAIAVKAIETLMSNHSGAIRFGLGLFPDRTGAKCEQDPLAFAAGPGNEQGINALLTAALDPKDTNYPSGPCVTNIDTAIEQAANDPMISDASRAHFVMLITDGKQYGCNGAGGDAGTTKLIKGMAAKGVKTFVVGFGSGVDPNQLNIFADAGQKPSGDPTHHYYQAEDQASLDKALAAIAGQTFGCALRLKTSPPAPDKIHIYFDGKEIGRDATNGWDYDAQSNTLTFFGTACSQLENNTVKDLAVVYGCPGTAPPPSPTCSTPCAASTPTCPAKHTCVAGCCVGVIN